LHYVAYVSDVLYVFRCSKCIKMYQRVALRNSSTFSSTKGGVKLGLKNHKPPYKDKTLT